MRVKDKRGAQLALQTMIVLILLAMLLVWVFVSIFPKLREGGEFFDEPLKGLEVSKLKLIDWEKLTDQQKWDLEEADPKAALKNMFDAAERARSEGKCKEASKLYLEYLDKTNEPNGGVYKAHYGLAKCYAELGNSEKALEHYLVARDDKLLREDADEGILELLEKNLSLADGLDVVLKDYFTEKLKDVAEAKSAVDDCYLKGSFGDVSAIINDGENLYATGQYIQVIEKYETVFLELLNNIALLDNPNYQFPPGCDFAQKRIAREFLFNEFGGTLIMLTKSRLALAKEIDTDYCLDTIQRVQVYLEIGPVDQSSEDFESIYLNTLKICNEEKGFADSLTQSTILFDEISDTGLKEEAVELLENERYYYLTDIEKYKIKEFSFSMGIKENSNILSLDYGIHNIAKDLGISEGEVVVIPGYPFMAVQIFKNQYGTFDLFVKIKPGLQKKVLEKDFLFVEGTEDYLDLGFGNVKFDFYPEAGEDDLEIYSSDGQTLIAGCEDLDEWEDNVGQHCQKRLGDVEGDFGKNLPGMTMEITNYDDSGDKDKVYGTITYDWSKVSSKPAEPSETIPQTTPSSFTGFGGP
tara:strand:- start:335 stop:2080 length:1746 start_codon:yes stop_codon:yes gene_type:complete